MAVDTWTLREQQVPERTRSRFSLSRTLTVRELAIAWVALVVLGVLAFLPHIRHGGFYSDDWSNAAGALLPPGGPGFGNAVSFFADLTIYRPVLVVYVPFTYLVLGMHMAAHLVWAAALAVLVSALLYGVLRTLGVPWIHAWAIAALTLVYPWFDSIRLWTTADQLSLSISFALAGVWVALAGLSRNSWRWHIGAVSLYLLSILTYEVTLAFIAGVGLLYVLRAGWRASRAPWAVDLAVVVAGGIWVGTHTARTASGLSGDISHLKSIVTQGGTLLGRTVQPLGAQHTTPALCAFAVVLLVGLLAYLYRSERFAGGSGWGLRDWLLLASGGLVVAALGWTMFIPADPYYTPSVYGITNRVNGLAGIGLVIALYGAFGIVGTLVGQLRPRTRTLALATTLVLGVLLGAAFTDVLRRHIGIWNTAFASEMAGLTKLKAQFPTLPENTTLFVAGYPANQTLGVPIMSANWDLDGMVKVEYDDRSLSAYPVLEGTAIECRRLGVGLGGVGAPPITAPYGSARMIDLASGGWSAPNDRRACRAVASRYVAGPLYLSFTY
jgi:hypothetical protein